MVETISGHLRLALTAGLCACLSLTGAACLAQPGTDSGAEAAPPPLPERPPVPAPPDVSLPPPMVVRLPKKPLAWRSRAQAMSLAAPAAPAAPAGREKGILSRTYACDFQGTLVAALSCLGGLGLAVDSVDTAAGHLLVSSPDGLAARDRFVLSLSRLAPRQTAVSIAREEPGGERADAIASDIFKAIDRAIFENGAL